MAAAIIVHHIDHITAALTAGHRLGVNVALQTPESAAAYAGVPYLLTMMEALLNTRSHPTPSYRYIIDCGDHADHAMTAIRLAPQTPFSYEILYTGSPVSHTKLAEMAHQVGIYMADASTSLLNLCHEPDPLQASIRFLATVNTEKA